MRFFFRKKRARKATPERDSSRQSPGGLTVAAEDEGYNPYDTLAGVDRADVGMRRRRSGKWSF